MHCTFNYWNPEITTVYLSPRNAELLCGALEGQFGIALIAGGGAGGDDARTGPSLGIILPIRTSNRVHRHFRFTPFKMSQKVP